MHSIRRALILTVAFTLLALPAYAQQSGNAGSSPSSSMPGMAPASNGGTAAQSPADQAMMAGMTKMNQDMSAAPMTGDADKDFVGMMMPHHQGAIDMAQAELQYGKDPAMRRLAKNIVAAQKKEIAEMKLWQAKHTGK